MEINELVQEFADCVEEQSLVVAKGDYKLGNNFAKRYITAFDRLRSFGDEGRNALAALLEDPRKDVRVMTAAYLLRHCEDRAKAVLEREAKEKGLSAFCGFRAKDPLLRSLDPDRSVATLAVW